MCVYYYAQKKTSVCSKSKDVVSMNCTVLFFACWRKGLLMCGRINRHAWLIITISAVDCDIDHACILSHVC